MGLEKGDKMRLHDDFTCKMSIVYTGGVGIDHVCGLSNAVYCYGLSEDRECCPFWRNDK